ncbi:PIN domain-like protein [Thamnocephalis sphaerospora]|uniref:PIN domain-like protein n=1 Tax=Thamnocephalis sphaerospora TaxID=78915 RepID=A0A4P9XQU6_9FUNG|nr:PIN domain-like protein [Thamnocephalis sphaerospora]|eukprot:RKP08427.1 PIN domain-like protein [Thamnocephalis sphaerospora]
MGISGLLPLLKSVQRSVHVSSLAGQYVAVDAYVWLHRGAYGCAAELGLSKPTRKYINYCMHHVGMLRHYGVIPVLVFDGAPLPAKAVTDEGRAERRKEGRKRALELHHAGQKKLAHEHFRRSTNVTPQMAHELIKALRKENVQYVVAPYEADAQLAYLSQKGLVSAVITEDSDALVFGCSRQVIFKMDQWGNGMEIRREELTATREIKLAGWSDVDFRRWCILSGCDYVKSLPGMGLRRAHKHVAQQKTLQGVLNSVQKDGFLVTEEYRQRFREAELTFMHQRVYDPETKRLVHLKALPEELLDVDMPYLGAYPFQPCRLADTALIAPYRFDSCAHANHRV